MDGRNILDVLASTLMTERLVSLFVVAIVISFDNIADNIASTCSGWKIVMSPLQN